MEGERNSGVVEPDAISAGVMVVEMSLTSVSTLNQANKYLFWGENYNHVSKGTRI